MKLNYIGTDKSSETQFKAIQVDSEIKDKRININESLIKQNEYDLDTIKTILESYGLFLNVGEIKLYAGSTAPTGWLICDGSAISRTLYSQLYSIIGTTYGSGDGSTTFNIPDFRAASPVGVGTSIKFTQNETITLAQIINDTIQGHRHLPLSLSNFFGPAPTSNNLTAGSAVAAIASMSTTGNPTTDTAHGTPRIDSSTHSKGIGINFIIKY